MDRHDGRPHARTARKAVSILYRPGPSFCFSAYMYASGLDVSARKRLPERRSSGSGYASPLTSTLRMTYLRAYAPLSLQVFPDYIFL